MYYSIRILTKAAIPLPPILHGNYQDFPTAWTEAKLKRDEGEPCEVVIVEGYTVSRALSDQQLFIIEHAERNGLKRLFIHPETTEAIECAMSTLHDWGDMFEGTLDQMAHYYTMLNQRRAGLIAA